MSDLVERLHSETDLGECGRLCDEAADEIARQQAVVDAARELIGYISYQPPEHWCEVERKLGNALRTLDASRNHSADAPQNGTLSKSVQRRLEIRRGEWEPGGKAYNECPDCVDGIAPSGGNDGSTRYVCQTCQGTKMDTAGDPQRWGPCPTCHGRGTVVRVGTVRGESVDADVDCPKCGGTGRKP